MEVYYISDDKLDYRLKSTGHSFAGATLPFGMAKAVADTDSENQGGFASDGSTIIGFSHMHDSGTGGVRIEFEKLVAAG